MPLNEQSMHSSLLAISPVDGRYYNITQPLSEYFSEYAFFKYRLKVEVEYLIALSKTGIDDQLVFDTKAELQLREWVVRFTPEEAQKIKAIENTTRHDVKALEYYIKEKLDAIGLSHIKEWVHFGLTSQDVNNTSIPLMLKDFHSDVLLPEIVSLRSHLSSLAHSWRDIPMLARTHGQPASPTLLGKEIKVFEERINEQLKLLQQIPFAAKFGGATGNMNAHFAAYPTFDWHAFADRFVQEQLGLMRSYPTTQIEHYDHLAAFFDALKRINVILIDLCQDVWLYISMDYFKQKVIKEEVGSSAMPHKVNPIDFENAEGNLLLANSLLEFLSRKLPVSRLQRDLTDSTILRNIGVPMAHILIALKSIKRGLDKLLVNTEAIRRDLESNWAVVTEAIQTILRREKYPNPYEVLKELSRKERPPGRSEIIEFINSLEIQQKVKEELLNITPFNYTGKWRTS